MVQQGLHIVSYFLLHKRQMQPSPSSPQTGPRKKQTNKNDSISAIKHSCDLYSFIIEICFLMAYLMPGMSLALVAMLTDSGHNFSTSSSGPHIDLL